MLSWPVELGEESLPVAGLTSNRSRSYHCGGRGSIATESTESTETPPIPQIMLLPFPPPLASRPALDRWEKT